MIFRDNPLVPDYRRSFPAMITERIVPEEPEEDEIYQYAFEEVSPNGYGGYIDGNATAWGRTGKAQELNNLLIDIPPGGFLAMVRIQGSDGVGDVFEFDGSGWKIQHSGTEFIKITSETPDEDGNYTGVISNFNTEFWEFSDTSTEVLVRDYLDAGLAFGNRFPSLLEDIVDDMPFYVTFLPPDPPPPTGDPDASTTQRGYVNLTTQRFNGEKQFDDGIYVNDYIEFGDRSEPYVDGTNSSLQYNYFGGQGRLSFGLGTGDSGTPGINPGFNGSSIDFVSTSTTGLMAVSTLIPLTPPGIGQARSGNYVSQGINAYNQNYLLAHDNTIGGDPTNIVGLYTTSECNFLSRWADTSVTATHTPSRHKIGFRAGMDYPGRLYAENGFSPEGSVYEGQTGTLGNGATCYGGFITSLGSGTNSGTNTGDQNVFSTIAVSGQDSVVAETTSDTLTLAAGSGISITTNASTDTVTIASTASMPDTFSTIAVSGQSSVVADSSSDTLTFAAGTGIAITTNASTDTITIAATGAGSGNTFETIKVISDSFSEYDLVADSLSDTLTIESGIGINVIGDTLTDTIVINSTHNAFGNIAVSGQSTIEADNGEDTLTLVAGSGINITTNASLDTVTFTASVTSAFTTIAVSGQSNVVADSASDTLTLVAGSGISITTDATADIVTIASTSSGTVTSVALSMPSMFSVTGSPITTSGNILVSLAAQSANRVLAGPDSGLDMPPTFRALVSADLASNIVTTTHITNANVTYAKIQNVAASRLLGNPTGSSATASEISLGSGLSFSGSSLTCTVSPPSAATQSEVESASSTTVYIPPARVQHHPGVNKAWVLIDSTTTPASILASYNVSSITDNGVGDFTVNFSTAFSSANYAFFGTSENTTAAANSRFTEISSTNVRTTTACRVFVLAQGQAIDRTKTDTIASFTFLGDQ